MRPLGCYVRSPSTVSRAEACWQVGAEPITTTRHPLGLSAEHSFPMFRQSIDPLDDVWLGQPAGDLFLLPA